MAQTRTYWTIKGYDRKYSEEEKAIVSARPESVIEGFPDLYYSESEYAASTNSRRRVRETAETYVKRSPVYKTIGYWRTLTSSRRVRQFFELMRSLGYTERDAVFAWIEWQRKKTVFTQPSKALGWIKHVEYLWKRYRWVLAQKSPRSNYDKRRRLECHLVAWADPEAISKATDAAQENMDSWTWGYGYTTSSRNTAFWAATHLGGQDLNESKWVEEGFQQKIRIDIYEWGSPKTGSDIEVEGEWWNKPLTGLFESDGEATHISDGGKKHGYAGGRKAGEGQQKLEG
jgi:hypothetical protein